MTSNQYRQQWQQGPTQVQQPYQYDRRDDQRLWQENGRSQGVYNQDYQQYNDYPQDRNGYDGGYGDVQQPPMNYGRDGHWQGRVQDQYRPSGFQDPPYYDNGNGYSQPPPPQRDPYPQNAPSPSRTYQYDERYRTNAPSRPQPEHHHNHLGGQRPSREARSDPSVPQKRSKTRERILAEPTSPKNLAWDNPFGAWPQKKKPGDRHRHNSLDSELKGLNLHERPDSQEARPNTSHGHRKRDEHRPNTAHGRRPSMERPMPLPMDHPMQPPEMMYQHQEPSPPRDRRAQAPSRPPPLQDFGMAQMDLSRPPPLRSQENIPPSPRRGPRQDPRGAAPLNNSEYEQTGPYGRVDRYGSPEEHGAHVNRLPPQAAQRNDYVPDEGYGQDYTSSRAYKSPVEPPQQTQQRGPVRPAHTEGFDPNGYRGVPNTVQGIKTRSRDMPNFDAIPTNANEKPEDHINTGQGSFDRQVYRKPTYQLPGSFPAPIDTADIRPSPPLNYNNNGSPLAEFTFDLPPSRTNGSIDRPPPESHQNGYNDPPKHGPGGYENPQRPQQTQFPPRTASRNNMKPPPIGDLPPVPSNAPTYRSLNQDQYPARPHTSNAQRPAPQPDIATPYDRSYSDQFRAPSAPIPNEFNQGYGPNATQQQRQPYGQQRPIPRGMSQENYPSGPPQRKPSQDNYIPGPPRPSTSSAHPVPVRHYGDSSVKLNTNPDALPAHPEPVRGGGNGYQPQVQPPQPATARAPLQAQAAPVAKRDSAPGSSDSPAVTLQELNSLRVEYSKNPANYAVGLKLAKKQVEAARVLADEGGAADAKTTQKNREKYIFDAHKLVKRLVAANYPDAMFYLADCHGQGLLGLPVDPKEAFHLYQSAAKLNHAQSAYRVAVCCELGSDEGGGTRRDPLKAIQWYKRAATLGDTPAMYKMGMILLKGLLGQQKSPREAVSWLKRAAERADKDNPHALHELGLLYESASGNDSIVRDERYAFQLFQQAAELGYKYSQFRLGSAFEYGLLGCPIDARQSIAWYTRAAAQGEHQSELALSGWYLTGSEPLLVQSDTEAFLWARKAASSNLAKAEYAMGYFNEVGIGTGVDIEEAKRWYYRAASQNFPKARERLEELKRGQKMQKTRVSRSNVNRQSDGECVVM
ncbi:hypothetical protein PV08_11174 [Exophiala spinifera]|uniref:Uncharacterized protein n=1 Tax=Exophiala spinifera TaxID=91928 RepID=A0A0D2ATZ2_9EURO|nr:uncharacterized protein PV08_11174 [Exophiala spinifera]KIW10213.1 hypothetical protein PV08_11174 [Exophiala spinifera]